MRDTSKTAKRASSIFVPNVRHNKEEEEGDDGQFAEILKWLDLLEEKLLDFRGIFPR